MLVDCINFFKRFIDTVYFQVFLIKNEKLSYTFQFKVQISNIQIVCENFIKKAYIVYVEFWSYYITYVYLRKAKYNLK